MTEDKLREILSSFVDVQSELIAAASGEPSPSGLSVAERRLKEIRRDLEPSSIDLLPAFRKG